MKKTTLILILLMMCSGIIVAQDQVVNGHLFIGQGVTGTMGERDRLYFNGPDSNSDPISIYRFNVQRDMSELRVHIGDDENDKFIVGRKHCCNGTPFAPMLVVKTLGQGFIGIGGVYDPRSALDVKGEIKADKLSIAGNISAREVKIEIGAGADFVFEPDYNLRPLSEVKTFITENKHLPEIPSEKQMIEEGVSVNEMQIKLLQKIEELTLYVIDQQKQINALQEQLDNKK